VAEVANAVVDEHARLQDGRHGGRHGGCCGSGGRRGGARRVLVDDEVVGGRGGGGGGRVAAAEEAREGRREAGAGATGDGSSEHFSPFPSLFSRTPRRGGQVAVLYTPHRSGFFPPWTWVCSWPFLFLFLCRAGAHETLLGNKILLPF